MEQVINTLLKVFSEQGIVGMMLLLSIFGIYKLLKYIKQLNEKHENRINELINNAKQEREETNKNFYNELSKLEDSHSQLISLYKDLKHLIDKLFDKLI